MPEMIMNLRTPADSFSLRSFYLYMYPKLWVREISKSIGRNTSFFPYIVNQHCGFYVVCLKYFRNLCIAQLFHGQLEPGPGRQKKILKLISTQYFCGFFRGPQSDIYSLHINKIEFFVFFFNKNIHTHRRFG